MYAFKKKAKHESYIFLCKLATDDASATHAILILIIDNTKQKNTKNNRYQRNEQGNSLQDLTITHVVRVQLQFQCTEKQNAERHGTTLVIVKCQSSHWVYLNIA